MSTTGHVGIVHDLDKLFTLSKGTLIEAGIALLAYAVLEGVEAIGLWHGKRWAEYLTFIATVVLLPFEIYELTERVSPLKLIGFVINLAVVVYLIYAKRLFGVRGGGAVDERERGLRQRLGGDRANRPRVRLRARRRHRRAWPGERRPRRLGRRGRARAARRSEPSSRRRSRRAVAPAAESARRPRDGARDLRLTSCGRRCSGSSTSPPRAARWTTSPAT